MGLASRCYHEVFRVNGYSIQAVHIVFENTLHCESAGTFPLAAPEEAKRPYYCRA